MKNINKMYIKGIVLLLIIPHMVSALEVPEERDCGRPYQYNNPIKSPKKVVKSRFTDHRKKTSSYTTPRSVPQNRRIRLENHRIIVPRFAPIVRKESQRVIVNRVNGHTKQVQVVAKHMANKKVPKYVSRGVIKVGQKTYKTTKPVRRVIKQVGNDLKIPREVKSSVKRVGKTTKKVGKGAKKLGKRIISIF